MIVRLMFGVAVLTTLTLSACSSSDTAGPPEIQYGRDICVQCGMIASEPRFAAAYRLEDGTAQIFDDLGDLILRQRAAQHVIDPSETWVHDFETEEWVDVANAYFVTTLSVTTPMGHNILAFSTEERAVAFASAVNGEVIRWDLVVALPEHGGLVGDRQMNMDKETTHQDHDG